MNRYHSDAQPMRVLLACLVGWFFACLVGCDLTTSENQASAEPKTKPVNPAVAEPIADPTVEPAAEPTVEELIVDELKEPAPDESKEPRVFDLPDASEISTLKLDVSLPEKSSVGKTVSLEWTLTNRGKDRVEGLRLRCDFGPGIERIPPSASNDHWIGSLGPGKTQSGSFQIRPFRPGSFSPSVEVVRTLASDWDGLIVEADSQEESSSPDKPKEPDLGPPLVDNPKNLTKLHPTYPVWFDRENQCVVVVGMICQQDAPLELFACLRHSKEHESIITVSTAAHVVHAGLLVADIEPGNPVQFHPKYVPASGPEIEITVVWKDEKGKRQQQRAQEWIRNVNTGKAMRLPFVFAGSRFTINEKTGERAYIADRSGALICVSNFPSAVLDLAVKSSGFNPDAIDTADLNPDPDAALLFEAFTERIPKRGTPVTLILKPKPAERE